MDENKNCVHIDYASFVKKSRTPQFHPHARHDDETD